jgi:hypothetical protein
MQGPKKTADKLSARPAKEGGSFSNCAERWAQAKGRWGLASSYLVSCVYPQDLPEGLAIKRLPGIHLEGLLDTEVSDFPTRRRLERKLEHSCRKIVMMCVAAERAIHAEREFYSSTVQDAPALFGEHAIEIAYHLEAFILFARSSLDIAAGLFGYFLFAGKRYDSFNELCKTIVKEVGGQNYILDELSPAVSQPFRTALPRNIAVHQKNEFSWLSVLCGSERGRALRDKIAHQTGFPIDYEEFSLTSEKEHAVVSLAPDFTMSLPCFIKVVREGVVENYLGFEDEIIGSGGS